MEYFISIRLRNLNCLGSVHDRYVYMRGRGQSQYSEVKLGNTFDYCVVTEMKT